MTIPELRTSERKSFKTCPQQWWWRYVEWLTPRRLQTPLWFGTIWHQSLADWYQPGTKRGPHPAETFDRLVQTEIRPMLVVDEEGEKEWTTGRELRIEMANNYIETYGFDPHMHILAVENTYTLRFKRNGKVFLRYNLTMDCLFRDLRNGSIWIGEHKTAKQIKLGHLHLDDQAGSYYAAAPLVLDLPSLIGTGRISGIMYNFARKAKKDERPLNPDGFATNQPLKKHYAEALKNADVKGWATANLETLQGLAKQHGIEVYGDVSKTQPLPLFRREPVFRTVEEQATQLRRIQDEALYMERMRAEDPGYPVYKTPGDHCSWCPFQRMCELDEQGDEAAVQSFKDTMMIEVDPHDAYRRKAA